MSTQASAVPRISVTNIYPENINKFLAALKPNNATSDVIRKIYVKLYHPDGSISTIDSFTYSYTAEYFEFVISSSNTLTNDVVKMELYGYVNGGAVNDVLMDWVGNTDNLVFKSGDAPNFKIRLNTTYQVQTS